jgi:type IV pilus assembly protein PilO
MAKLTDMPAKAQLAIFAGLAVVATLALYFLYFRDIAERNNANTLKLQARIAENDKLRPYERNLPELNRTIDALQLQLENLQRIVPDEEEADGFMHLMQNEARKAGIEIRRYTAKPAASREFYTEVPFDMELDGPYYSVLAFFDSVAKLERIINISNVQLAAIKGVDGKSQQKYQYAPRESVIVSCTATTFFSSANEKSAVPATGSKTTSPVKR